MSDIKTYEAWMTEVRQAAMKVARSNTVTAVVLRNTARHLARAATGNPPDAQEFAVLLVTLDAQADQLERLAKATGRIGENPRNPVPEPIPYPPQWRRANGTGGERRLASAG